MFYKNKGKSSIKVSICNLNKWYNNVNPVYLTVGSVSKNVEFWITLPISLHGKAFGWFFINNTKDCNVLNPLLLN